MHISDGLLPAPVCVVGFAATGALTLVSLRRTRDRDIPRLALMTSAFFAASLLHVRIGATSVHLLLHGLVGAVVGPLAVIPIAVGVFLQALLFAHGGITTMGVNAVVMGIPALLAGWLVRRWGVRRNSTGGTSGSRAGAAGFLAGTGATIMSLGLLLLVGLTAGRPFFTAIGAFLVAHAPLAFVEGLVTAASVTFLARVKPEVFDAHEAFACGPAADSV
ncbi:MAG: cobalt transporter CbiM [Phycisphaerales bacterium]|nr:MAG: cobalt transporter CbiM [Phycisphaerales bacterium]